MDTHEDHPGENGTPRRRKIILRPRSRVDYPRRDKTLNEEYAAEVSPLPAHIHRMNEGDKQSAHTGAEPEAGIQKLGYFGLGFGIASLFIWSIILGPVAAVLGYFAYGRGERTTGAWAMGLGLVSTLSYFVMIPFVR